MRDDGRAYVPHFDVTTVDGGRVRYRDLWQRRQLLLALFEPEDREAAAALASQLKARARELDQADTTAVVTTDAVPGLQAPRVVVADRWGEIQHVIALSPGPAEAGPHVLDELISWATFVRMQCPECPP
jgi:hypothetical protein